MGRLMIFFSKVKEHDSVVQARLRDSNYDHTIWAEVEDLESIQDLCSEWSMPYAVAGQRGSDRKTIEMGRTPNEDETGFVPEN